MYIITKEHLMHCGGVYWKVAICCLPLSYYLAFLLPSIAYYTILGLDNYYPMHNVPQTTFPRVFTKPGYMILIGTLTHHHV